MVEYQIILKKKIIPEHEIIVELAGTPLEFSWFRVCERQGVVDATLARLWACWLKLKCHNHSSLATLH